MNEKRILIAIFLLALALRAGGNLLKEKVVFQRPFLYFGAAHESRMKSDSIWYDGAATSFLEGKGLVTMHMRISNNSLPVWVNTRELPGGIKDVTRRYYAHNAIPPLYPLFLAICYYVGGMNTLSYFIPQLLLSSLTCIVIYLIAKEIFDSRKIALTAALCMAFYPDLIFWTGLIRTETLFIFLLSLGFLFFIRGNLRGRARLIFAGALILGLACLTRVTLIPFIPILFIWQIFYFRKDKKASLKTALVMLLLIFLVLLPWSMRNYLVFGNFTPFTDEVNVIFIDNSNQEDYSEGESYHQEYGSSAIKIIAFIRDNLKEYTLASMARFVKFWSPITAPMRPLAKVYKGLSWLMIFPLAFWGIIASRSSWRRCGLLVVFIFYYSLLHAASFMDDGLVYRYPIQPFICIFTAYGFWAIYGRLMIKRTLMKAGNIR